jgi:carbamoyltransferase
MLICGLKISHDASVALIDGNRLRCCIEIEKLMNNPRYSEMGTLGRICEVLQAIGVKPEEVDRYVVDGWHDDAFTAGEFGTVSTLDSHGGQVDLRVGSYNEGSLRSDILSPTIIPRGLELNGHAYDYTSYKHVAGHVLSAYCTSPFAKVRAPAYVLVWDGGQYPRLYFVDPSRRLVENLGHIFGLLGTIYGIMGHYFGPYKRSPDELHRERMEKTTKGYFGGHSIAGKLMSYIALGNVDADMLGEMRVIYRQQFRPINTFEHEFMQSVVEKAHGRGLTDADVLMTLHAFIESLLLSGLQKKLDPARSRKLCFCGGSALNIKWNSAIRNSGLVEEIWVPPFPNDAGSGIGAACCEMVRQTAEFALDWSVYCGLAISVGTTQPNWGARPFSPDRLAQLLASTGEPIVVLNGAAELGPRALGNRSILAPAVNSAMKDKLNAIKQREAFRPVSPICLEQEAPAVFDPGISDPYMLFDHKTRPSWADKVPAIVHLDGTARLQTVSRVQNSAMHEILSEYFRLTGIPLLCNTSANFRGSGFFPDVASAMRWDGTRYIFSEGTLYEKFDT